MKQVPLTRYAQVAAGQAAPSKEAFGLRGIPFIRAGSLEPLLGGKPEETLELIEAEAARPYGLRLFPAGTIFFAKSGMSATLGRVYVSKNPAFAVSHLAAIIPHEVEDAPFLAHWLRANPPSHLIRDEAYPSIRLSEIERLELPNFDQRERHRIAAVLDKADVIRRKRRQALALADDFLRSAFLEMFGDIKAKKTKFPLQSIRGLVNASSGKSSKAVICEAQTDFPIYGGNGINGWASQPLYNEPVIVVGRVGQQCGITRLTDRPAWVTDNAIAIRIADANRLDADYLEYALQMSPLRSTVQHLDLPFINQGIILDFPLPVPPIEEQRRFARTKKAVMVTADRAGIALRETEKLFASLSQRAFHGHL